MAEIFFFLMLVVILVGVGQGLKWCVWKPIQAGTRLTRQLMADASSRRQAAEWAERDRENRRRERIRERQAAEERDAQARRRQRAQKRRQDARARCEVFFSLHAPELGSRFTKQMFADYVRQYMGDAHEPDEVEERATQLCALMQSHLEKAKPAPKFRSLGDIAQWFEEQKRQLADVPDDRVRQALLAKLKARYTELTTEFLEGMQA